MTRKFYVSYVRETYTGENTFYNTIVLLDVAENEEKKIPVLLHEKISKKIGNFIPVTLINFWEID